MFTNTHNFHFYKPLETLSLHSRYLFPDCSITVGNIFINISEELYERRRFTVRSISISLQKAKLYFLLLFYSCSFLQAVIWVPLHISFFWGISNKYIFHSAWGDFKGNIKGNKKWLLEVSEGNQRRVLQTISYRFQTNYSV